MRSHVYQGVANPYLINMQLERYSIISITPLKQDSGTVPTPEPHTIRLKSSAYFRLFRSYCGRTAICHTNSNTSRPSIVPTIGNSTKLTHLHTLALNHIDLLRALSQHVDIGRNSRCPTYGLRDRPTSTNVWPRVLFIKAKVIMRFA